MDVPSHEKCAPIVSSVESHTVASLPSIVGSMGSSMKLSNGRPSLSKYQYNFSRSFLLRRARYYHGHQFSRRVLGSNIDTLKSLHINHTPCNEMSPFKWAGSCSSESGYHAEGRGRPFRRPERIRGNNVLVMESSSNMVQMACGLCLQLLRRRSPCALAFNDLSVVAILVCGHVYHADCLDQRTSELDKRDPPCPLCVETPSAVDAITGDV